MKIDRRGLLALIGAGAAAGPATAETQPNPAAKPAFRHGVASGDPLADRVILWTRVSTSRDVAVRWEIASDPGFRIIVAKGAVMAQGARDHCVKVDAKGLKAGTDYYYRFKSVGVSSPVGRTRTLPKGLVKDVVLAAACCTLYPAGYFNAYGAIAALPRLDAVVYLGDYIYEYGGDGSYGQDSSVGAKRPHDPYRETVSLDDYRRRHAQYKTDPQLQAAHARAPWIVVWDDHETANDSWKAGAQNHQPATEGDWSVRKAAAIKAYYEWMPIREPADGGFAIQRSFDFGDLASLFMLETRLTARDQQVTYGDDLKADADLPAFKAKLDDPARRMMSASQEAWLRDGMAASVRSGKPWQVLGNEVLLARVVPPPARQILGAGAYDAIMAKASTFSRNGMAVMQRVAAMGLPFGLDMWDGYPADRDRLYRIIKDTGASCIAVSGDSHASWANELFDAETGGERVAVEFGVTGISSPGYGDTFRAMPLGQMFADRNREVLFSDQNENGFVLLTLTRHEAKAELMTVSTTQSPDYTLAVQKAYVVKPTPRGVSAPIEVSAAGPA